MNINSNNFILKPKNDYVFKKIFGDERNKDILIAFLKAVLKIDIEDVQILNSELPKENISDKKSILDIRATINNNVEIDIEGVGNGPIDSLGKALYNSKLINISIMDYKEHALSKGSEAEAAAYVYMKRNDIDKKTFGVGVDSNITRASIKSIISAINRLYKL